MTLYEFETVLDNRRLIRVPQNIAAQLAEGTTIRVSITPEPAPAEQLMPDEAWAATLAFIWSRMAKGPLSGEYQWRRGDAYDHLKRYGSDRAG